MTLAIHQLLSRYQRHLTLRTALLIGLGVGCVAALSWRLWLVRTHPLTVCGVGLTALAGLAWWQRRALQQVWAARTHASLVLDRLLGLEARLITAEQFADVSQPPALYARLMEDPALVRSLSSLRPSPITDRRTLLLAVVLLALLLWPWRASAPPQLASLPPSSSMPPEIPPPTPPPPLDQPQSQTGQQQSGSQQQAGSQQQQQGQQQSSGGAGEQPQSPQPSQQQKGDGQSSGSADRGQSESSREDSQSHAPQSQTAKADGAHSPRDADQTLARQSGTPQATQQTTGSQQQQAKTTGQQPGKDAQEQASPPAQTSEGRAGKTGRQGSAASGQGAEQAKAGQPRPDAGRGQEKTGERAVQALNSGAQPLTAAQQEAVKADIQQMLQQLSTELKHLQAELQQQAANQPSPPPGTSTDPNLFEDASKLEPPTGGPLPIHLDVDTQPTSTTRRGGGVGQPSGEAVEAPFQVQPESVDLADSSTEAPASQRQAIPPEYRPVFERLSTTINE